MARCMPGGPFGVVALRSGGETRVSGAAVALFDVGALAR
jgi:hypothetical protein